MSICIAGMHRSGTSLLSRLLNHCGLYLGPDADILPAEPSNSDGHWENIRFIAINEALMAQRQCAWDHVRPLDDQWELASSCDSVRERAAQLVRTFAQREPWGWKDPRNSLTLPFWLRLIPNLKVIVCVRHPLEVAASLRARNKMPATVGVRLWIDYYARLMKDVPHERRLVVHYQSLLSDTRNELSRVLQFAEIPFSDASLASVASLPKSSLRHHSVPFEALLEPHLPLELAEDYVAWCVEAGPSCQQWLGAELADFAGFDAADSARHFAASAARLSERERHAVGLECDELERYAHSIKAENIELRAASEGAHRYAQSLEAERSEHRAASGEAQRYAQTLELERIALYAAGEKAHDYTQSLLAENAALKAMCAESERYALSLAAEHRALSERFAEVEKYALSLEEALKARRQAG